MCIRAQAALYSGLIGSLPGAIAVLAGGRLADWAGARNPSGYVAVPEQVSAELSVTRASTGLVLGLRLSVRLHGPCVRCLTDAVVDETLRLSEYQATSPDSDELTTPYLKDDRLDLSAWARDALILALPDKILCRADCAGLCPLCGRDLNTEPHEHQDDETDPRWAALQQLRDAL